MKIIRCSGGIVIISLLYTVKRGGGSKCKNQSQSVSPSRISFLSLTAENQANRYKNPLLINSLGGESESFFLSAGVFRPVQSTLVSRLSYVIPTKQLRSILFHTHPTQAHFFSQHLDLQLQKPRPTRTNLEKSDGRDLPVFATRSLAMGKSTKY